MLDYDNSFDAALNVLVRQENAVEIPVEQDDFFNRTGALPLTFDDQRQFRRSYFRKRAILQHGGELARIYTLDLSRGGLAFLHVKQLFPLDQVSVWLESLLCLRVEVARCRRIEDCCFECGARLLSKRTVESEELVNLMRQASLPPDSTVRKA